MVLYTTDYELHNMFILVRRRSEGESFFGILVHQALFQPSAVS